MLDAVLFLGIDSWTYCYSLNKIDVNLTAFISIVKTTLLLPVQHPDTVLIYLVFVALFNAATSLVVEGAHGFVEENNYKYWSCTPPFFIHLVSLFFKQLSSKMCQTANVSLNKTTLVPVHLGILKISINLGVVWLTSQQYADSLMFTRSIFTG